MMILTKSKNIKRRILELIKKLVYEKRDKGKVPSLV